MARPATATRSRSRAAARRGTSGTSLAWVRRHGRHALQWTSGALQRPAAALGAVALVLGLPCALLSVQYGRAAHAAWREWHVTRALVPTAGVVVAATDSALALPRLGAPTLRTYTVQFRDAHGITRTAQLTETATATRRTTVTLYVDPVEPERAVHVPPPTRAGAVVWACLALASAAAAIVLPRRVWQARPGPAPSRSRHTARPARRQPAHDPDAIRAALDALDLPDAD